MTEFDDQVSDALRALHTFGNKIMLHLSGRQDQKEEIEKAGGAWDLLKRDLGQAMANNRNDMSIKQTKHHRGGVSWVDTTLVNFMSAVNTVIYDTDFKDQEVRDMVRKEGIEAASQVQQVAADDRMQRRPLAVSTVMVGDDGESGQPNKENRRLTCPYGCQTEFGSTKTLTAHVQKFHQSPVGQKRPGTDRTGRQEDSRVTCALCGKIIVLHRMKEHLQRVHHRGPYTRNMKFRGFEQTSPGHYEPLFEYASGNSGCSVPIAQPKTFPCLSSTQSGEDVSEEGADKSDESPFISDVEPLPADFRASTPVDEIDKPVPVLEPEPSPVLEPQPGQQLGARRKLNMGRVGKTKKVRKTEVDTDHEDGDTEVWTEGRRRAKELRYRRRTEVDEPAVPLHEMQANKSFVEDYNSNRKLSGRDKIHKYTRDLFCKEDSWLAYKTRLTEGDFGLDQLVDWTGRLTQPGEIDGWLKTVPAEPIYGSKRTEMVKAYGTLLDHLKGKAQRRMLADGVPSQERQTLQFHINMLETTRQVMNEKRHLASAQKIGKEFVAQKKLNLNVLYPRLQESIRDCVKAWNQSELNQEHLAKLADIYKKAVATRSVYATDYQHCVQYLVFCLALLNSNRKNSIELLRVKDFSQARKVYQEDEGKQLVSEGGEYFGKVVELLPSSGPLKGGAPVTMFFNTHVLEMMNMVADLARWFFVGEMKPRLSGVSLDDPLSPLFLTVNGRAATVDKSMFKKFAAASGLPRASANTLRKVATSSLMTDPKMRALESETLGHTDRVRAEYYDQGSQERKVITKQWLNKKNEGAAVTLKAVGFEINNETRARWDERDEEEAKRREAQVSSFLNAASKASNPAKVFSSQWKVLPADREMIAKDMLSRPDSEIYSRVEPGKSFPADKANNRFWTRSFYRYLDTMEPSETAVAIRDAEHRIFQKSVKPDLMKEGVWEEDGEIPNEVQRIADRETAAKLRVSFMTQVKMAGGKGRGTKDTFCKFKF